MKLKLICLLLCLVAGLHAQQPGWAVVSVPSGATPTLQATAGHTFFQWTLTGNVTSSTFSSAATGDGSLMLCEDGTGGRTVVFPSNFQNFSPLASTAANYCQYYSWEYDSGSGNVTAMSGGVGMLFQGNLVGAQVTASTTQYAWTNSITFSTTEAQRSGTMAAACTAQNLFVRTASTQSASGAMVVTLRKNGAPTALTFTIAAGAIAQLFKETTDMVAFGKFDSMSIELANAATASSGQVFDIGVQCK